MHLISVSKNLCEKGRGKNKIKCPFFELCGAQRQRHTMANIWFGAHELIGHEMPKTFGKVGKVFIDESPLGALVFGTDKPFAVALDKVQERPKRDFAGRPQLMEGRVALYDVLAQLEVPDDEWQGAPVKEEYLGDFMPQKIGGDGNLAEVTMQALFPMKEMHRLEWQGKVEPPDSPGHDFNGDRRTAHRRDRQSNCRPLGGAVAAAGGVRARPDPQQ